MAQFKKGDVVRQIVKPIEGVVEGFQVDQETGQLQYLVAWQEGGEPQSKYFGQGEVEVVQG